MNRTQRANAAIAAYNREMRGETVATDQELPADTSWLITTDGLRIINGRRVYMTSAQRERFNALVCELDRMMDVMEAEAKRRMEKAS